MNELVNHKLSLRFDLLDRDRNGYVDQNDYVELADRVSAEFGRPTSGREADNLRRSYLNMWTGLMDRLNRRPDERLSRAEFVEVFARIGEDDGGGSFRRYLGSIVQSLMDVCGTDQVDEETFRRVLSGSGLSPERARAAFERIDTDHDGVLSREEMLTACEEFHFSRDPDAPGNRLFGDPEDIHTPHPRTAPSRRSPVRSR